MNGTHRARRASPARAPRCTLSLELDDRRPAPTPTPGRRRAARCRRCPSADLRGGDARRILVVDDNEFNRAVLARQVAALGYEAEQASRRRGSAADARARRLRADPGRLPDARHGRLRVRPRGAHGRGRGTAGERIPIVAWTANVMPDDVAACRDAGMDDVLAKPSALPTVQRVLRHLGGSDGGSGAPVAAGAVASRRRSPTARRSTAMQLRAIMDGDAGARSRDAGGIPHRERARKRRRCATRWRGATAPPSATPRTA